MCFDEVREERQVGLWLVRQERGLRQTPARRHTVEFSRQRVQINQDMQHKFPSIYKSKPVSSLCILISQEKATELDFITLSKLCICSLLVSQDSRSGALWMTKAS